VLPDLRAITLKALMKAGGVDYLTRQAEANPMGFMSLLGRVMPREAHIELSAEVRIRQEVRRDLVEKLVILMKAPEAAQNPRITHDKPIDAVIAHSPDTMLKAQASQDREGLSRRGENARREGLTMLSGVVQRAASMQIQNAVMDVIRESEDSDELQDSDQGIRIENKGADRGADQGADGGIRIENRGGGTVPRGRPYVCPPLDVDQAPQPDTI
jgi:hypothetical protein